MGDKTKIQWTDATWNPLRGCSRVSDGCRNCYAESVAHRFSGPGMPYEGLTRIVNGRPTWTGEVRMIPELLDQPLRWRKPRRIFVNSMSDLFHENVPDEFIYRVLMTIAHADRHAFQILTKRPERMRKIMQEWGNMIGEPPRNAWLGVSVENQAAADERIPLLLDTPAAVRWLSAEPLLEATDVSRWLRPRQRPNADGYGGDCSPGWTTDFTVLDWIVAGGESGPHARPTHPEWMRSLRDQCKAAGVRFFFKQWGEWIPGSQTSDTGNQTALVGACQHGHRWDNGTHSWRIGKKAAGRRLDGVPHDEYPEDKA